MRRILLYFAFFFLLLLPFSVFGSEIIGPEVRVVNDEVLVTTGLSLDEKSLNDLKNGISKEITFYIDLFKVWNIWPNEFISGKKLIKALKSDPVKKEFVATSFDGVTLTERRFKDLDSMLAWAVNIKSLKLINSKELEPAGYFVRITLESRIRKLPPVIGYLLFFVPERDYKLTRDSNTFNIGTLK